MLKLSNLEMIKMSCSFTSKKYAPEIIWKHRKSRNERWSDFPCDDEVNRYTCKNETTGDNRSYGECHLSLNNIRNSGYYKCVEEADNTLSGEEFFIQITGVESIDIISRLLKLNKIGFVTVKICSNPKPHLIWYGKDQIVHTGQSSDRYSGMPLSISPISIDKVTNISTNYDKYCWITSLIIKRVTPSDREIKIFIISENFIYEKPITFTNFPMNLNNSKIVIKNYFMLILLSLIVLCLT
uniref:Ig-like domain-containing protein n=1 Tax=Parastrongyloides trichosuri TaxID=131310 RepID=A0A0N4Z2R2_PARTI